MGLAERRAVERFKTEDLPQWLAKIQEVAGFAVPLEVAWDELAVADYARDYPEFFGQIYFQPLVDALAGITIDEMGKEALRDGLGKIVVKNCGQYSSSSGFTFVDKVLTIDHRPEANVPYVEERAKDLRHLLESRL